jgi:hypothetical protein
MLNETAQVLKETEHTSEVRINAGEMYAGTMLCRMIYFHPDRYASFKSTVVQKRLREGEVMGKVL